MSNEMNEKKEYLVKLGDFLTTNNKSMSGHQLADHLNHNNILTENGEEYKGGRGIYVLIDKTNETLENLGRDNDAENVKYAFVNEDDEYIWD
jgi:hypothetical protein